MKRYSEYTDSGVKWIGEIPSHWKSRFLSQIASEQNLSNKGMINDNLLSLSYGRIIRKSMDSANGLLPASFETYQVINNGNIILRFTDLQNDHKSLRVGLVKEEGIITSAYTCITPKKSVLSEYLYFLLHSADIKKVFYGMGGGLRQNLNYAEFRKLRLMIPPLPEQNEIVAYLDKKVSKIDRYISTAEKKIAELDELKQVTIADAVTHGINPNAPMKDSGIPWIGMVPEHWIKLRAKNIFKRQFREVRENDDIVTCFRDGQVTLRKNRRTEGFTESLKEIGYQGIRKGDLVLHQMDAFAGSIGVSDSDGKGTPVYICCLSKGESNVYYYAYLLREMAKTGFIKSLYRGIRERSSDFRFETFAVQWLPVLPLPEQNEIVAYIDHKVAQIDKMRASELAQIEKLKEYKQRLISDVVTGKVKVIND